MKKRLVLATLAFMIGLSSLVYGKQAYSDDELENAMRILRENQDYIDYGEFMLTGYSIKFINEY